MPDEDVEVKAIFAAEHKIVVLTDKNGTASAEAMEKATGTYGQFAEAAQYIDPRKE